MIKLSPGARFAFDEALRLVCELEGLVIASKNASDKKETKQRPAATTTADLCSPEAVRDLLKRATSPFPLSHLIGEVLQSIADFRDPDALQPALFSLLGDGNIEIIFQVFEMADAIRSTIDAVGFRTFEDLCKNNAAAAPGAGGGGHAALEAATLMAVAAAAEENSAALNRNSRNNKHADGGGAAAAAPPPQLLGITVKRVGAADKQLKKSAKLAKKAAAIAKKDLAGLSTAESDFLQGVGFDPEYLEQERALGLQGGGFRGASDADIAAIRAALDPEGSREYYEKKSLPTGTTREYEDGYEVVKVPAKFRDEASLPPRVVLSERMDETCLKAFAGVSSLNPMQSMTFEAAFNTQENLLICAPTGAGKTNVAMLTVLAHFRDQGVIGPESASDDGEGAEAAQFQSGKKVCKANYYCVAKLLYSDDANVMLRFPHPPQLPPPSSYRSSTLLR